VTRGYREADPFLVLSHLTSSIPTSAHDHHTLLDLLARTIQRHRKGRQENMESDANAKVKLSPVWSCLTLALSSEIYSRNYRCISVRKHPAVPAINLLLLFLFCFRQLSFFWLPSFPDMHRHCHYRRGPFLLLSAPPPSMLKAQARSVWGNVQRPVALDTNAYPEGAETKTLAYIRRHRSSLLPLLRNMLSFQETKYV